MKNPSVRTLKNFYIEKGISKVDIVFHQYIRSGLYSTVVVGILKVGTTEVLTSRKDLDRLGGKWATYKTYGTEMVAGIY